MRENLRIGSLLACVAGLILAWVTHQQGQSWAQLEANGIEVAGTVVRATVKTEQGEVPDYWLYVEYRPENDSSPLVSGFQVRKPFFQTVVSGDTIVAPAVRVKYEPGQPKKAMILGGSIPEGGAGAVKIMLGIAGIGLIVFVVTGLLSEGTPKAPSGGQTDRIGFEVSHLPVEALAPMEAWILAKCQETGIECSFLNIGFMQDEGQGGVPGSGDLYFEGSAAQAEAIVPLLKEAIVVHVPASELSKVEMHAVQPKWPSMNPTLITLLLIATLASAADPAPPATQTCLPDQLIAAEAFDQPEAFAKGKQTGTEGWRGGIGQWSIRDGAAYAIQEGPSEKRPNGHEAVCEHIVDLGDLVLTGEFKLGTSPQVGFVCRDTHQPNHHLGHMVITPTAIWIQKMSGIAKETRREELTKIAVKLDANTWHRITLEVCGDRFFARIDDHTLEATHERFKDRKGRVGMVAKDEGAQFRNLTLWSAKPKR